MDKLVIIPAFGALYMILKSKDARHVFYTYFLPLLTLIPAYYEAKLAQGIPEFSFWSSALIPVFLIWIVNEKMEGYEFSWLDVIIILNLVVLFYAQFDATGYKDAQKIVFREFTKRVMPYLMMKAIMLDRQINIQALKMITYLGVVVSLFMLYEFKFYFNYMDLYLRNIWPHYVPWDGVLTRFGFKRAAGSFGHPISAGYFFAMVAPLAFWLWRNKKYRNNRLGMIIFGFNILGVITSISRAPIAGLVLSFFIIWFGWSKSKAISGAFLVFVSVIALAIMAPKFIEYISIDRSHAKTRDQENAAYRKEMMDNYIEVIKKKPYWGYGRYTFPVIHGQKSIDNEYLFISITAGLVNLALYLTMIIYVLARLLKFAIAKPFDSVEGRLAWALIGGWVSAIFTQATVYSGMQTTHYFYMIAALSEALILSKGTIFENNKHKNISLEEESYDYYFSRTL